MKVRLGERTLTGSVIDLRDANYDLAPDAVVAAVRSDGDTATISDPETSLSVVCPTPGPVHEHVGLVRSESTVSLRHALAAAARSRGHTVPQDDEIAAVRDRLAGLDAPDVDLAAARRRVADATGEETELRERVAALRGRVQALREDRTDATNCDVADAEAELADAAERLSAAETERIAAEQALAAARECARESRDRRRARLRLQDREANLRRAARERLADTVREEYEAARNDVLAPNHDDTDAPTHADTTETTRDPVAAALAVARVAALDAPVVLASDRFEGPTAAASWLDAPVIRL